MAEADNVLVLVHHNELMTTSLAIAEGVGMPHKSVIQLIRKYIAELQEFGPLAFEMRKGCDLPQGGYAKATEFAYLNEQQSTLLLTFMRNSEIVVRFKVALVKAFFEMRDHCQMLPLRDTPLTLSHRADDVVAADRVFRSFLRSARSARLPWVVAIRCANEQTLLRTGMDMLAELKITDESLDQPVQQPPSDPLVEALRSWVSNQQSEFTLADAARDGLGMKSEKPDRSMQTRIGTALSKLGCKKIEKGNDKVRFRYKSPR